MLLLIKKHHDFIFKNKYACTNNLTPVIFQFLSVFHQINISLREFVITQKSYFPPNSFIDSFSSKITHLTAAAFCVCTHKFLIPQDRMASSQDTKATVPQAKALGMVPNAKSLTANAATGSVWSSILRTLRALHFMTEGDNSEL